MFERRKQSLIYDPITQPIVTPPPTWKIVPVIGGYHLLRVQSKIGGDHYFHVCDEIFATIEDADRTIEHLSQPPIYRP